ncbi:hypothetical protein EPUS_04913 [Endocarpon pusillum Z07020]|uniref:DUF7918 domain-containing protein n=1 Tax=Endocarpon pusillum (strain Z07020 / HMAS-L-300199) TaxID=1263415 RepID=U1HYZ2_ENDPU|nr:uncharacterized protein EPUS_04913 [Endocarpon pusillum Z07020]ERF74744.1 hypothetical protein EPUS_04913 [Endocarpon pusillum Z07020]
MPLRHGLDVSIISSSHERFTEYGVNTHARSKLVTAKIEARSGVQFYIAIRPEYPFPTQQNKRYGSSILTRAQAADCPTRPLSGPPSAPTKRFSGWKSSALATNHPVDQQAEKPSHSGTSDSFFQASTTPTGLTPILPSLTLLTPKDTLHLNTQLDRSITHTPAPRPPPFDLIVQVHIDGRRKAEVRFIVHLNPSSPDYQREVLLVGRRVRIPSKSGEPPRQCFHDWVFTDVGIEVLLERMGVEDTTGLDARDGEDHEVAALADELQDAAKVEENEEEGDGEGNREQELKIGKIEVVFTRVVLGEVTDDVGVATSENLHDAQSEQAIPKRSVGKDVTHTTSIVPSSAASKPPAYAYNRIKWTRYNPTEDFYAKFIFDYTSRAKLVKWGLCDEAGVPVGTGQEKQTDRRRVQLHTNNPGADGGDSEQQQRGSLISRGGHGIAREEPVPATEHASLLQGGGRKRREKEKDSEMVASRKREIARAEEGARAHGVVDADVEQTPAKRRDRTTRLPRLDRGEAGGRRTGNAKHNEQRRHSISGYGGDVVDEFAPVAENAGTRVVERESGAERWALQGGDGEEEMMGGEGEGPRMETPTVGVGAQDWGARLRRRR